MIERFHEWVAIYCDVCGELLGCGESMEDAVENATPHGIVHKDGQAWCVACYKEI